MKRSGGPFLFGQWSIADAMYAPVVTRFVTYAIPRIGRKRTAISTDGGRAAHGGVDFGGGQGNPPAPAIRHCLVTNARQVAAHSTEEPDQWN